MAGKAERNRNAMRDQTAEQLANLIMENFASGPPSNPTAQHIACRIVELGELFDEYYDEMTPHETRREYKARMKLLAMKAMERANQPKRRRSPSARIVPAGSTASVLRSIFKDRAMRNPATHKGPLGT